MKPWISFIAGLLLLTLIALPAYAGGGNCPAFNSSMIDAAFLATEYSQPDPVIGEAMDSPNDPRIHCEFVNGDAGYFVVSVGYDDNFDPPGNVAHLIGSSPVANMPSGYATYMRTLVPNLSDSETHACRAQVLASFTWKRHCKPLMQ